MQEISMDFLKSKYLSKTIISATPAKEDKWTLNGFKLAYLIAYEMSEDRLFIDKKSNIQSLDDQQILDHVKLVKRRFIVKRDEFQKLTGVDNAHIARAIKESCADLMKKNVTLANPLDPTNPKSFKMIHWFNEAEYNDLTGEITIEVDKKMIPYMVVLVTYTKLDYKYIIHLKNIYSARIYLICKITQNKYQPYLVTTMSLCDFKNQIGVGTKYTDAIMFKKRIMEIAKTEINNKTDLNFDYCLIKSGKKFTHITLKFSQKKNTTSKELISTDQPQIIDQNKLSQKALETDTAMPIVSTSLVQLRSYGITETKASTLLKDYGEKACQDGIQSLLSEIQNGKVIKNIAGYLVKCIENTSNKIDSEVISEEMKQQHQIQQEEQQKLAQNFDDFEKDLIAYNYLIQELNNAVEENTKLNEEEYSEKILELELLFEHYDWIAQDEGYSKRPITEVLIGHKTTNYAGFVSLITKAKGLMVNKGDMVASINKEILALKEKLFEAKGDEVHYIFSKIKNLESKK